MIIRSFICCSERFGIEQASLCASSRGGAAANLERTDRSASRSLRLLLPLRYIGRLYPPLPTRLSFLPDWRRHKTVPVHLVTDTETTDLFILKRQRSSETADVVAHYKLREVVAAKMCDNFALLLEHCVFGDELWLLYTFEGPSVHALIRAALMFSRAPLDAVACGKALSVAFELGDSDNRVYAQCVSLIHTIGESFATPEIVSTLASTLPNVPQSPSARAFVKLTLDVAERAVRHPEQARGAFLQAIYALSCAEKVDFCHGDLHSGNFCVQFDEQWRVLFETDDIAFFIPPGLRCIVIDFGVTASAQEPLGDRNVEKLLQALQEFCSVPVNVSRSGTDTRNMTALWQKLIQVPEFASFGVNWREQRPHDFDIGNALLFSRESVKHGSRKQELTNLCVAERAWTDSVNRGREIMANHAFIHFRGGARLNELKIKKGATVATVECWIVLVADDDGCGLPAVGWLVAFPGGDEPVIVISSEPSTDMIVMAAVARWRSLCRLRDGDLLASIVRDGRWLSEFADIASLRAALSDAKSFVAVVD
jgi:hypothetical protein